MSQIGLIDYGAGNFASVKNALHCLELPVRDIRCPEEFELATHLILPGVGAFAPAMRRLESLHLVEPLRDAVLRQRKPLLGICVGMQLFATVGSEFEVYHGLGLISGAVKKLKPKADLRLPHIGWNTVEIYRPSRLFARFIEMPTFYFLHSYHLVPSDRQVVVANCNYGEEVTAAIEHENLFGVQFHPEKSQQDGLRLLQQFASL